MEFDGTEFSIERVSELHNTLLTFILALLEKYEKNKIIVSFEPEELELLAEKILSNEFTLNSLFEPITDEEDNLIRVDMILQRLNKSEMLLKGLFDLDNNDEILM